MSNKKATKDEKYEKMMQAIDLKIDRKEQEHDNQGDAEEKPSNGQISINDLISNVEKNVEGTNDANLKAQAKSLNKKVSFFPPNHALNT